ncbi:DUF6526 family protein [Flavobacterium subsaxonicum]|uniref:Uncharacterized protein n=1 Tax=Flavobacterium subsaxonicum WB 4.1-42 = DSM 21790 TaxID=1121898 RepID=A0A0A2MVS0_9FLAO|nr:DUF6526 family protein [Flavobacterium subsaxonicum]KGO92325.1 hypothetical protein Q766_12700 [Flavobacterium subsaxonicum WB 4.1-42 = DSM 21790]
MAKQQNYKNHIRFYPPHHFVFYPVMLLCMAGCTIHAWQTGWNPLWIALDIVFACITWVAYMLRQHYALTLQNRIVLMELRYRYFVITGQRLEPLEAQLTEGQLFALRFAPDEELPALASRAIAENLTADAIKRAVQNWKADNRRV